MLQHEIITSAVAKYTNLYQMDVFRRILTRKLWRSFFLPLHMYGIDIGSTDVQTARDLKPLAC